jgi:hypothetical protein
VASGGKLLKGGENGNRMDKEKKAADGFFPKKPMPLVGIGKGIRDGVGRRLVPGWDASPDGLLPRSISNGGLLL